MMSILSYNRIFNRKIRNKQWFVPFVLFFYNCLLFIDSGFRKELDDNVKKYKKTGLKVSSWRLKQSMLLVLLTEFFHPYEYRCFDFWGKDKSYRDKYISDEECLNRFRRDMTVNKLPRNKYERFLLFKSFFKRDITDILLDDSPKDKSLYQDFQLKHPTVICKPVKGTKGKGVEKVDISTMSYEQIKDKFGSETMLEELIIPGEELSQFHPASINTVRFVTGLSPKGKFSFLYALFRTGCGGSVVDNVGAGGIIASISKEGVIDTDGMKYGQFYSKHPDTDIEFKGFKIPAWKELNELAEKAHRTMPSQRLFGWDFSWTPNGWDLVEVNPAPAFVSYQILKHSGVKQILKDAEII